MQRRPGRWSSPSAAAPSTRSAEGVHGERGYAYNFGEREDDLHAVAAPIWGSHGELAAIIGVQGPASRFDADAMDAAVEPLLAHAREVSLELGWTGLLREPVR